MPEPKRNLFGTALKHFDLLRDAETKEIDGLRLEIRPVGSEGALRLSSVPMSILSSG